MQVSIDQFTESQEAIMEYISYHNCNHEMREARVVIKNQKEKIYDINVSVYASIENNYSFVDISWDDEMQNKYYIRSKNDYQIFEWFNGTLSITTNDKEGNDITIYVS